MADAREACRAIVARYEEGALSAQIALMELLIASEDEAQVAALLAELAAERSACARLHALLSEHRAGCATVTAMLRGEPVHEGDAPSTEVAIARCRALFDQLVSQSPEASVALYSLGSPEILAAATAEVVDYLRTRGLVSDGARVLDLGCGIGRIAVALAPHVAHVAA